MRYVRMFLSGYNLPDIKHDDVITLIVNGQSQNFKATYADQIFPEESFTVNLKAVPSENTVYNVTNIPKEAIIEFKPGFRRIDTSNPILNLHKQPVTADGTKGMQRGT